VLQRFEALTHSKIVEGYGLTETSPVTHANPLNGRRKIGSIGVPLPDTDVKLVHLDGASSVPAGEAGELLIRGPQVMPGYWRQPEETKAVLEDGWLRTGDLATIDEDGYCYIVGRRKDLINVAGYKVYPDEVDAVLMAHADVLESATIGVPDERSGERVKSFVVLREGCQTTVEQLVQHARANLAAYKVPHQVEFLRELPKSSVLKVLRRELRDRELAARATQGGSAEG
jgi:long-chain acyl-CoA synthetase